jgi:ribosome biogenesis GTPase A
MANTNIWQNLSGIKEQVSRYALTAKENEWITPKEHDELLEKIQNDTLTIGVIGQMKAGKSTFLNALLFKNQVLPVASNANDRCPVDHNLWGKRRGGCGILHRKRMGGN